MVLEHHYLIQYGRPGFVGHFAAELSLARGDRVVVRGPRGIECGEVLVAPKQGSPDDGEVLRVATRDDEIRTSQLTSLAQELLAAATDRGNQSRLPLAFVDIEVTLDGTAILHALAWDSCDATLLLDELATRFGLAVRMLDLSRTPVAKEPGGCGKPGCGSESSGGCSSCGTSTGGGCSTGSCSRGSVKSADELTAYFADLRGKMEEAGLVRTPLN